MFFFARGWEFAHSGSRSGSKSKESFTRAVRELSGCVECPFRYGNKFVECSKSL